MPNTRLKPLVIGDKVAPLPIVQGGMGVGISLSGLASAAANEGGVGVIAAAGIGMFEPDFYTDYLEANRRALRREIRRAKSLTKGVLGVNIMCAFSNYSDFVRVAVEEGIDLIFSGAGLPMNLPSLVDSSSTTKLIPIVSSGRATELLCQRWLKRFDYLPDAIVVEGTKAGGHLGFKLEQIDDNAFALENLVTDVLEVTQHYSNRYGKPIPVIAAGGIYTGRDIRKFLELGADAVQMGTRFVATEECDADDAFKQAYIDAGQDDIVIIESPVGMPGRAIRNKFLNDVNGGLKKPYSCPYHCILSCDFKATPYCIANALMNAKRGRLHHGFAFAGSNVFLVKEIVSVKKLMATLVSEYEDALKDEALSCASPPME
ncbi:MAG: nitronate monooxygenase family protein [Candidatus Zixiibacteriota bacterium]